MQQKLFLVEASWLAQQNPVNFSLATLHQSDLVQFATMDFYKILDLTIDKVSQLSNVTKLSILVLLSLLL